MPEVGVRYTEFRTTKLRTKRVCAHCKAEQEVEVLGVGHGSGDASHLLGNYGAAQSRAVAAASSDAESKARLMLGLVPCPKCGKRDGTIMSNFLTGVVGTCVAIGLGAALVGFLVLGSLGLWAMILGPIVAVALSVGIYFWAVGPLDPLKHAAMCVKFLDGP